MNQIIKTKSKRVKYEEFKANVLNWLEVVLANEFKDLQVEKDYGWFVSRKEFFGKKLFEVDIDDTTNTISFLAKKSNLDKAEAVAKKYLEYSKDKLIKIEIREILD